jgi:probable lipoprotein NlpC
MNMLSYFVRFNCKYIIFLAFFLLMQTAVFARPPIQIAYSDAVRSQLLDEAEKYLGVPYRYGGTSLSGMDCSGFVYLVFQNTTNISIPRTVATLYSWAEKIDMAELQAGDLLFFNTTGTVSHVGIYAGNGRFIHAASDGPHTGVIISAMDESYWKRTYIGAGRAISQSSEIPVFAEEKPIRSREDNLSKSLQTNDSNVSYALGVNVSFNNYIHETRVIRGAGFLFGVDVLLSAEKNFSIGLELRPQWDIALGVFRLPVTLSFGGDMFRAFVGPALSFGNPVLSVPEGKRFFNGGTSWIGEAGITFAPVTFNAGAGKFALYGELAWQFYHPKSDQQDNWMADISAATRVSAGVRYMVGE